MKSTRTKKFTGRSGVSGDESTAQSENLLSGIERAELERLVSGEHSEPHRILGAHPARLRRHSEQIEEPRYRESADLPGVVIRALDHEASAAEAILESGDRIELQRVGSAGLFAALAPKATLPLRYRLRFQYSGGATWETDDPYRFLPTLGDVDLHLFNEGNHRQLWKHFGSHPRTIDGVNGVAFAVWAPSARRVSVVSDFNHWDGRRHPMRQMGSSGVFEIFIPAARVGQHYKYEIKTSEGAIRIKTDPLAGAMERPPGSAARIVQSDYAWGDGEWMMKRPSFDHPHAPMAVYEVHLGSWARVPEEGNRPLTYREIAPQLIAHVKRFGFTHLELLPIAEHPFTGSWGYQVTGYYAPTSWYGTPDDFRYFVDLCHQNDIGVIIDWVPAHFPKDDFALRRFDGTALYEHEDPRMGEHPDWGTLIFNYGRNEVRNFLMANALYWLDEFHVDGLRVDAVASMLYLDYSREQGQWIPNRFGGRENLEAIEFLRATNQVIAEEHPGCFAVAEESTAWPGVTRPVSDGGLGFTFKWNMGWMHDTLLYFGKDSVHRRFHHDQLTFAMLYEYTERFIMPLSHDEVVHGKGSLLQKMPGDLWQKFANLRLLLAYQYTRPGKKLLFMGAELAPQAEWNHDASLDWHLAEGNVSEPRHSCRAESPLSPVSPGDAWRKGLQAFMEQLGALYHASPCLWAADHDPTGFAWIDCNDRDNSVIAYWRRAQNSHLLSVLNLTPVPRENYRIGAPFPGRYNTRLCSDDKQFAGSGFGRPADIHAEAVPYHGFPQSLCLRLPPLSALVLAPDQS